MTRPGKPQIHFARLPGVFDCQLVHGQAVSHRFPRHIHQTLTFGLIEQGMRVMTISGETFRINTGDCFVIHPGEAHSCHADLPHDYRTISLSNEALRKILALPGKAQEISPHFAPPVFHDDAFTRIFLEFAHEAQQDNDSFQGQSLLVEFLNYAFAHFSSASPDLRVSQVSHSEVRRVRQYLETHFDEPICLDTLADVAGFSPYYLNRIFQTEIGIPPYEYLVKIRLKHAQEMIDAGRSIAEAAHHSGFADQSHFTRFFKRHVGLTPGEFRQQCHVHS